jgi:hypothetical protein
VGRLSILQLQQEVLQNICVAMHNFGGCMYVAMFWRRGASMWLPLPKAFM